MGHHPTPNASALPRYYIRVVHHLRGGAEQIEDRPHGGISLPDMQRSAERLQRMLDDDGDIAAQVFIVDADRVPVYRAAGAP